jgi:DNA-binding Lrp family transcriptional regulator
MYSNYIRLISSPHMNSEEGKKSVVSTLDSAVKKYPGSDRLRDGGKPAAAKFAPTKDEILSELENMSINTNSIESLSDKVLLELLTGLKNLTSQFYQGKRGRPPKSDAESALEPPILSNADKKILKSLIASSCNVSSLTLSRDLNIPLSTVQRRRKRLEASLIETVYQLKLDKFGWRNATLFVATASTSARTIGAEMMSWEKEVVAVKRCMGENSADLQIDILFKSNRELCDIIERVKTIEGVTNVSWSESIETLGRNTSFYERVIQG